MKKEMSRNTCFNWWEGGLVRTFCMIPSSWVNPHEDLERNTNPKQLSKSFTQGAEVTAPWLGALAVLPEDLGSLLNTHIALTTGTPVHGNLIPLTSLSTN